jgi:hypothetical protein
MLSLASVKRIEQKSLFWHIIILWLLKFFKHKIWSVTILVLSLSKRSWVLNTLESIFCEDLRNEFILFVCWWK